MFFVNESYVGKTLALFVFFKNRLTLVSFAFGPFSVDGGLAEI